MLRELHAKLAAAIEALEPLAVEGGEAYDTKMAEVKGLQGQVERLKAHEELKMKNATPLATTGTIEAPVVTEPTVPAQAKAVAAPLAKGTNIARLTMALAATKGNISQAAEFAKKHWGDSADPVVKNLLASVGTAGGYLVPQDFREELIALLRPASVVMSAGPRVLDMPNGNMTIPGLATGVTSSYVGETQPIPPSTQTYRAVTLVAKKLASLIPISNDFLRYPNASTDAFVRDDMISSMATRGDVALLRGDGGQFSPKGLRTWALEAGGANFVTANPTFNLVNVTADSSKLILALQNANVAMLKPVWLMSPRTRLALEDLRDGNGNFAFPSLALANTFRGFPVKTTTTIPDNLGGSGLGSEIYLVDMAEFIIGEAMNLEIAMADGAAYWDGTQTVSAFSQDQTVMRAIAAHDSAMRQPKAVAVLDDVRWA